MIGAVSSATLILVGVLAPVGALAAAWIGQRTIRKTSREDRRDRNTTANATSKVAAEAATLQAWDQIVKALQHEVKRLIPELAVFREEAETCRMTGIALVAKIAVLERELGALHVKLKNGG